MTDTDRADTLEAIIQQLTYCLSEVEQANVPIAAVLIDAAIWATADGLKNSRNEAGLQEPENQFGSNRRM